MNETTHSYGLTAGYDGSPSARAALLWAVTEAQAQGATLHVVVASQPGPVAPWAVPPSSTWAMLAVSNAEDLAREAKHVAGGAARVTTAVHEGLPSRVLARYGEHSDMLVVGSSGHLGLAGWLRGSVSRYLLHHAACPLVVVGPESFTGPVRRLVVSATLDPEGETFGTVEDWVARRHSPVHVIGSYSLPTLIPDIDPSLQLDLDELHATVLEQLTAYVDRLHAVLPAGTTVTSELDHGLPVEVLDRQTRLGDLIVVPRGCEHDVPFAHARCPVCVV